MSDKHKIPADFLYRKHRDLIKNQKRERRFRHYFTVTSCWFKRKVAEIGGSTHIRIPSKIRDYLGISNGDEVEIIVLEDRETDHLFLVIRGNWRK